MEVGTRREQVTSPPRPSGSRRRPRVEPDAPARRRSAAAPAGGGSPTRSRRSLPVRFPELALGILLVTGCALGGFVWQRQLTAGREVVVAQAAIARGSTIAPSDLAVATVRAGDDIAVVDGARITDLVGLVATVDIAPGTPLAPSLVTEQASLAAEDALASAAIARGHLPPDLAVGDTVGIVVMQESADGTRVAGKLLTTTATVWSVTPPTDYDAATIVTLRLPLEAAVTVGGSDDVRLVRLGA